MPDHRLIFKAHSFVACLICAIVLVAFENSIRAEDASLTETNEVSEAAVPLKFMSEVREETGRGFLTSRCAYVTVGATKFSFLVPDATRVNTSLNSRLVVFSDDFACSISVRLAMDPFKTTDPDVLRENLLNRYPDAVVAGERAMFAASFNGPCFDIVHTIDGVKRKSRIGFVPSAAGVLEISMISSPEAFDKYESTLHHLLNTFRASKPDGTLDTVRLTVAN